MDGEGIPPSNGLAFSGGGIRSASFCTGVLRYILQKKVNLGYLSCVSGGGYAGAAFLDWKFRHGREDNPNWHQQFFNHFRRRIGAFCSWRNPCVGLLDSIILLLLFVFVGLILPILTTSVFAFPTAFTVEYIFGDILRAGFKCPENGTRRLPDSDLDGCLPERHDESTFVLFLSLVAISASMYFLKFLCCSKLSGKFHALYIISSVLFLMTFLPWFFEVFLRVHTSIWLNGFILLFSVFLWLGFPPLRKAASLALLAYMYAYITKWRVYRSSILFIEYSENVFYFALWGSAILMWLSPFLGLIKLGAVQTYNRWRLQKAFFSVSSARGLGCGGISLSDCVPFCWCGKSQWEDLDDQAVSLGDLTDMRPQYICNTVVNNWQREKCPSTAHVQGCAKYELLTMAPTGIERLDENSNSSCFEGKLQPNDIKLSDAMATSAAALAFNMGIYGGRTETFRDLQMMMGVNFGKAVISDPYNDVAGTSYSCFKTFPILIQLLVALPIILPPFISDDWHGIVVAWYLATIVVSLCIAAIPTGLAGGGCSDRFVVCGQYISREVHAPLIQVIDIGPVPPPLLNLSDGGHVDNMGLLALLKKKLKKIVVVDGSKPSSNETIASGLIRALDLARIKLRCSFSGVDGRDIKEDIRDKLIDPPNGRKPRFYQFTVHYYEKETGDEESRKTGEGSIMYILPRHPKEGTPVTDGPRTWDAYAQDTQYEMSTRDWGPGPDLTAAEVDRLGGCCCECCHVTCCGPWG